MPRYRFYITRAIRIRRECFPTKAALDTAHFPPFRPAIYSPCRHPGALHRTPAAIWPTGTVFVFMSSFRARCKRISAVAVIRPVCLLRRCDGSPRPLLCRHVRRSAGRREPCPQMRDLRAPPRTPGYASRGRREVRCAGCPRRVPVGCAVAPSRGTTRPHGARRSSCHLSRGSRTATPGPEIVRIIHCFDGRAGFACDVA